MRRGTITIEQPTGGWINDQYASFSAGLQGGPNQYSKGVGMSLFRPGFRGHIAPAETFTVLTDSGSPSAHLNELPLSAVVASNAEVFMTCRNGRLVQFDVNNPVIDTHNDPTAHGGHTVQTSENVDTFVIKTTTSELVLSVWEDDVDADVMKITSAGGSKDDDWFSTLSGSGVLTKGVPHIFAQSPIASKGLLLNGQYVAEFDVIAGTGNTQKLNLGAGWIGTSQTRKGNYVEIIGYFANTYITGVAKSNVRVWLWDGYSPNANFSYDIPDNYASAIFNDNGRIVAFTQGANNTTKAWVQNEGMARFDLLYESSIIGNPPRHNGVETYFGALHYGNKSAEGIYVLDGAAFHNKNIVTDGSSQASDIGFVKNLSSNILYCGVKVGSDYKVYKTDFAGYYVNADFRTGLITLPFKARVTEFRPYFSQFGTGASVLFSFFKNYNTLSIGGGADLLNKTISYTTYGAITEKRIRREIDGVSSFYMNFRFNHASISNTAAIIRKFEVDFEEVPGMP
jgi:hypothetical protein